MYYIEDVDLGTYNESFYAPLMALGRPPDDAPPRLLLRRLSFDQNLIGKSRILWERVMNLVYLLETGKHLEKRRSKKAAFDQWLRSEAPEKWRILEPYGAEVQRFDDRFRTPEFHKNSMLRAGLL